MKSYTDIEQSKKLAEILPLESADMFIADVFNKEEEAHSYNFHILSTWGCNTFEELKDRENKFVHFIPCWSLAALLGILPPIEGFCPIVDLDINLIRYEGNYRNELCFNGDNLVDVCYEMIIKLKELNLL